MKVTCCRVCDSTALAVVLDLGLMPLANRFLKPDQLNEPEPRFPLCLVLCSECGLLQLDEEVSCEALFNDSIQVSGTSDLVHHHAAWLARTCATRYQLGQEDLVLEAASNDGSALRAFRWQGLRVLGIEPSAGIAAQAIDQGIDTVVGYFGEQLAQDLVSQVGKVRLFLARHVLSHVGDLSGFVGGIKEILAPDGVAIIEVPHLASLYEKLAFDTIYHEHLCYFSLSALRTLFRRLGLQVIDAEKVAMHGGSLLLHVTHAESVFPMRGERMADILQREEELALGRKTTWQTFARGVHGLREQLLALLDRQRARGQRLAGYGAPAKSTTLLSFCGIGIEHLPYIVDRSPYKQGLFTPGSHIPVHGPEMLCQDQPDVTLLLAWHFAEEIIAQQTDYQARGGRFALPLPVPRILGAPSWSTVSM